MLASLPFILLLILQGFARQDCAEFLFANQDLVNLPCQAKSIKTFDDLLIQFSLVGKENKSKSISHLNQEQATQTEKAQREDKGSSSLQSGYLKVQRSRDGPAA